MAVSTYPWREHVDILSITDASTTSVTLNELVALVTEISVLQGGATSIAPQHYSLEDSTIGPATAAAGVVQSLATPSAPNNIITFDATNDLAAGSQVLVRYIRPGDMPAA